MVAICTLDFETYSEANIKHGVDIYAPHPSTDVLCLSWMFDGDSICHLWTPDDRDLPIELYEAIGDGCELHAHNAGFEIGIWQHVMTRKYDAPTVPIEQWHCTLAAAAALSLPRSLEQLCQALRLPMVKDAEGSRVMKKLSKPSKGARPSKAVFPDKFLKLYEYCKQDVRVQDLVRQTIPSLSSEERKVWILDQKINARGIPMDPVAIGEAIILTGEIDAQLLIEFQQITGLKSPRCVKATIDWLGAQGANIENLQAETITKVLHEELEPLARRVLEIRQQLGKSSVSKFRAMADRLGPDARIRGTLRYCGAGRTGRWSGQGVQFHNLPSRGLSVNGDNEIETAIESLSWVDYETVDMIWGSPAMFLSSLIRPMVQASTGKRLLVCDYAQIELRVLAWMARQRDLIDVLKAGGDPYRALAARIFSKPESQIGKSSHERFIGKEAVLGFGYQMGETKFRETLQKKEVEITEDFAYECKKLYRQTYANIPMYWAAINNAAITAVTTQAPVSVGAVWFSCEDRYLFVTLPSGRRLAYVEPEVKTEGNWICLEEESRKFVAKYDTEESAIRKAKKHLVPIEYFYKESEHLSYMGVNSFQGNKWQRLATYGGKLVENIIQGISRDFMAYGMLQLERAGYPVIFTVHDEVIVELVVGRGSIREMESIMSEIPNWGVGCPIAAEGFETTRYRK